MIMSIINNIYVYIEDYIFITDVDTVLNSFDQLYLNILGFTTAIYKNPY